MNPYDIEPRNEEMAQPEATPVAQPEAPEKLHTPGGYTQYPGADKNGAPQRSEQKQAEVSLAQIFALIMGVLGFFSLGFGHIVISVVGFIFAVVGVVFSVLSAKKPLNGWNIWSLIISCTSAGLILYDILLNVLSIY